MESNSITSTAASTAVSTVSSAVENTKAAEEKTTESLGASAQERINDAAVYEKSSSKGSATEGKTIQSMLEESNRQTESFKKLLQGLFVKQSSKKALSEKKTGAQALASFSLPTTNVKDFIAGLEVDDATVQQAKADISEDGYYGVKQTSARILDFAKAVAGNDPDKLEEMRAAVEKGFAKAESMWGGQLPDICQNTYDTVMKGFDDWANEINGIAAEA